MPAFNRRRTACLSTGSSQINCRSAQFCLLLHLEAAGWPAKWMTGVEHDQERDVRGVRTLRVVRGNAEDLQLPPEVTPALRRACEADVRRLCIGVNPTIAKVKVCVSSRFSELGKRCQISDRVGRLQAVAADGDCVARKHSRWQCRSSPPL